MGCKLDPRIGRNSQLYSQVNDIVDFIIKNSNSGDVILIMSSGDFGGIHQKILEGL